MKTMADFCHWCDKEIIRGSGFKNFQLGNRFCDDDCRTKYHNAKKKVAREKDRAFDALDFIHNMLLKQGDLKQEALEAAQLLAKLAEALPVDCYCGNCQQRRFLVPMPNDVCDFCQSNNWIFKPHRKNPSNE